jgi:hypothetical protein
LDREFRARKEGFPHEFFDVLDRHLRFFGKFIRRQLYAPLANRNGAILEMLDEKIQLFVCKWRSAVQDVSISLRYRGTECFEAHFWKTIGIGSAARSGEGFDRAFNVAFPQAGSPGEWFDVFSD